MTIEITPEMLCSLCGDKFTFEACDAICEYYDEIEPIHSPMIGDICILFSEIAAKDVEDDSDDIVTFLNNGNVLIHM